MVTFLENIIIVIHKVIFIINITKNVTKSNKSNSGSSDDLFMMRSFFGCQKRVGN